MISRAFAHRQTQFGNKLCVPRTRRAQRLFCGKFLDRHAVFNRPISFSKGSNRLIEIFGSARWLHEDPPDVRVDSSKRRMRGGNVKGETRPAALATDLAVG